MQFRIVSIFLKWNSYETFEEHEGILVDQDGIEQSIRNIAERHRKIPNSLPKGVLVNIEVRPVEIPGLKEIWNKQGRGYSPYPCYQKE